MWPVLICKTYQKHCTVWPIYVNRKQKYRSHNPLLWIGLSQSWAKRKYVPQWRTEMRHSCYAWKLGCQRERDTDAGVLAASVCPHSSFPYSSSSSSPLYIELFSTANRNPRPTRNLTENLRDEIAMSTDFYTSPSMQCHARGWILPVFMTAWQICEWTALNNILSFFHFPVFFNKHL